MGDFGHTTSPPPTCLGWVQAYTHKALADCHSHSHSTLKLLIFILKMVSNYTLKKTEKKISFEGARPLKGINIWPLSKISHPKFPFTYIPGDWTSRDSLDTSSFFGLTTETVFRPCRCRVVITFPCSHALMFGVNTFYNIGFWLHWLRY